MMRRALAVLCWVAPFAGVMAQQPECRPDDTVRRCIELHEQQVKTTATARGATAVTERTQRHVTGLGVGDAAASISDFLPKLATSLFGTGDAATGALALDYSVKLDFDPAKAGGQTVRARVTRHKPLAYAAILDALPDSVRDTRKRELEGVLSEFDDVEVQLAWNLESGTFGRSFEQYDDVWSALFVDITARAERRAEAAGELTASAVSDTLNVLTAADMMADCSIDILEDPGTARLGCLKPGPRARIIRLIRTTVAAEAALDSIVHDALINDNFYRFGDLVNNQPQLNLTAHGRFRDDAVGPNTWGGTLRFELGFANVNRFRSYCRRNGVDVGRQCPADYLAIPGVASALGRGDRGWLSVDYAQTTRYVFALAADGVALDLPGSKSVTAAGGFGRNVGSAADVEAGRVDLELSYVFRADDQVRDNRFVGSLSYTQRVSDGASLVLGINYASDPEYLGEVDEKLSAHFGIRYALHRPPSGK